MSSLYYEQTQTSSYSMSKVFGWMFYAILITALTAFGLPYALVALNITSAYYGIMIGGLIALVILSFVGNFIIASTKSKPVAITIFTLFSISMGIWISPIILMYELSTIFVALTVTAGIFGVMAIYGAVTKRDLTGFGSFLFMILFGAIIISFINIFVASSTVDWIISYVILAVYIGFIAFDVQRVKRIADSGQMTTNIALLMALNLYIDFVYIFIRLVALIGASRD